MARAVSVASLGALLGGASLSAQGDAQRHADAAPYGLSHAAAAAALRFGDGGAYPETQVEQHPLGMGVGVAQVHQLRLQAGRLLLADVEGASRGSTPEHVSLTAFLLKHGAEPLGAFPGAVRVERGQCVSAERAAACLSGEGQPLVVCDALREWACVSSQAEWTVEALTARFGADAVTANDRAPARHADAADGRPQASAATTLREYVLYLDTLQRRAQPPAAPPFYLNGWRAFAEHPELRADCPVPYFLAEVDHTEAILTQLDQTLFRRSGAPPASPWWRGTSLSLWKLFLGPRGTVTRMHYDAGDAHGWLAQLQGTKLFLLYPPANSARLRPLASEAETVQSGHDPLGEPPPPGSTPHVALLGPGEAILIPRGWWHYAAALEPSLTAQCNFYSSPSNASALVKLIVEKAKLASKAQTVSGKPVQT